MTKKFRTSAIAALGLAALTTGALATGRDEIGSVRFLACQGATFNFPGDDFAGGAFNNWCYDARGKRVAMIKHGPVRHVLLGQGGERDAAGNAIVRVTFVHYDDRDSDGVLEDSEEDGVLSLAFRATPAAMNRIMHSPSFDQVNVSLEVGAADLSQRTGWFAQTEQVISRTNLHVAPIVPDPEAPGLPFIHPDHNNFSVLSFLSAPVSVVP